MKVGKVLTLVAAGAAYLSAQAEVLEYWTFDKSLKDQRFYSETGTDEGHSTLLRGTSASPYRDCKMSRKGVAGHALRFDEANPGQTVAYNIAQAAARSAALLSESFGVELFVNPSELPDDDEFVPLVHLGEVRGAINYSLRLAGDKKSGESVLQCVFTDGAGNEVVTTGSELVTKGVWSYVAVFFDASTKEMILQVGDTSESFSMEEVPASNLNKGRVYFSLAGIGGPVGKTDWSDRYYIGEMDEVRISNSFVPLEERLVSKGMVVSE